MILLATMFGACENKPPEELPRPDGYHGALIVRKVEISSQQRFKYFVTVATKDDEGWSDSNGHFHEGGYSFYTNAKLEVGQDVVGDTTIPYIPVYKEEEKRERTVDTVKFIEPDSAVGKPDEYRIGDSVTNQKTP